MEIRNYEDINNALKKICECEVGIANIEGEVTLKINEIKEGVREKILELENEKNFLEQEIENFCSANKADFAEKRSKDLVFGTIGYRVSKSVSLPRAKAKVEALIDAIKKFGFRDCLIYEEKPNKDVLCELDDSSLVKLGIKRVVKDNFKIVSKIENLQNNA
ncbi:host-nuclease inhibitor Gam family protein [Helicobacter sp. 13S00477-4]|uniref:host-nuclease inhibitor Gam family protein n=1 Tax=Helicobacter sp. 13S00477-4 TaxID=1905759 RepID=UPI000BA5F2E5|nr:host-nuclease inhibitor Gam family protein [Helicobacter sp. 13S00477-4]PAF51301.1 host-nuclease inhibitor protein Gam [Helicobacter sp. 13S00477-4]